MKESAQIIAVFFTIVFGFAAIANTDNDLDERVQLVPCEIGVFKLVYLKKSSEKVNVTVLSEDGKELKTEEVYASSGFVNIYDLQEFGSGEYVFRIQDSTGQVDHEVYYDAAMKLALCQIGQTGKYKLVAENNETAISIDIYNANEELILSEEMKPKASSKVLDLSRIVEQGEEVSFLIKEDNRFLKIATF